MIESITLPVTAFNPKKWKKFVLAKHWFSVHGLPGETLSATYWGKTSSGRHIFCVKSATTDGKEDNQAETTEYGFH